MPWVFSVLNLKGGVGKTTVTVAIAHILSGVFGKRVLVIDIDPQMNSSLMLLSEKQWSSAAADKRTIADFIEHMIVDGKDVLPRDFIVSRVGDVHQSTSIDIIPSTISLAFVETAQRWSRFFDMRAGTFVRIATRLRQLTDYDVIVFDCPPSLGPLTMSALHASESYFIPTIPDVLSTYGIPELNAYLNRYFSAHQVRPKAEGIIINRYKSNSTLHRDVIFQLQAANAARPDLTPPVVKAFLPDSVGYASAAEYGAYTTLKQKWGYYGMLDHFVELVREICRNRIDLKNDK